MKMSADEERLFLGDGGGDFKLMSLKDGTTIKDLSYSYNPVAGIVTTEDEKFLFTSTIDGVLKKWNYKDANLVRDYG
jgi:hypothetical protein